MFIPEGFRFHLEDQMVLSRLVNNFNRTYPFESELWMEEGAWYKVGGLHIVPKG